LPAVAVVLLTLVAGPLNEAFYPSSWLLLSSFALAETVFLLVVLVSLAALARLLGRGGRTADAVVTGLCMGVAIASRYLGVALVATMGLLVLWQRAWPVRRRLRVIVVTALVSVAPTALWVATLAADIGLGEPSTPPHLRRVGSELFTSGVENLAHWFVPDVGVVVAAVVVAVVVVGCVLAARWLHRLQPAAVEDGGDARPFDDPLWAVLVTFAAVYLLALLASRVFANTNIGLDARLIAPVRAIAYVIVVALAYRFARALVEGRWRHPGRACGWLVFGVSAVICVPSLGDATRLVTDGAQTGELRADNFLAAVDRLPDDALILTNAPETLWLSLDRRSIIVPIKYVPEAGLYNEHYERDVAETVRLLARPNAYLAMFRGYDGSTLATVDDLEPHIPLDPVGRYGGGVIYRASTGR
jgi:hypothetical protein